MSAWRPDAFRAIVFDLDDTLYREADYVLSGFRAVAKWAAVHLGIPAEAGYAELESLHYAKVRGHTFDIWLADNQIEPEPIISQLVAIYRQHRPQIEPFGGARPLLKAIRRYGYRIGLLSDGYLETQERKLAALQLDSLFDAIVFSDAFGRQNWKPSPIPYRAVAARLGVETVQAIYIADNPSKDFLGARSVGMGSIRLRRSDGIYADAMPESADFEPDHVVDSLGALNRFFCQEGFYQRSRTHRS